MIVYIVLETLLYESGADIRGVFFDPKSAEQERSRLENEDDWAFYTVEAHEIKEL